MARFPTLGAGDRIRDKHLPERLAKAQLDQSYAPVVEGGYARTSANNEFTAEQERSGAWTPFLMVDQASQNALSDAQNPQSVYDAISKRTFLTYTGRNRDHYVTYYDHVTHENAIPVIACAATVQADDDHSPATIMVDKVGVVHLLVGSHGGKFRHCTATSGPGTIATWSNRQVNELPAGTYQSVAYDAVNDVMWTAFRAGGLHGTTYPTHEFCTLAKSTDRGATWVDQGGVINTSTYTTPADRLTVNQQSFINDLTGWQVNVNATIARVATGGRGNGPAMAVTPTGTYVQVQGGSPGLRGKCTPGETVNLSIWGKCPVAGRSLRVNVLFWDGAGAGLASQSGTNVTLTAGTEVQATGSFVAPANAAFVAIQPQISGTAASGDAAILLSDAHITGTDKAWDAYIMDLDCDAQGRPHLTWTIAHGEGHDGPRSDVFHAYWNPATSTMRTMDGTDLGASVDTSADHVACRVYQKDWIGGLKHVVAADGSVLLYWNELLVPANKIGIRCAKWNGSAWSNADTGIRHSHGYHGHGVRKTSTGYTGYFIEGGPNYPAAHQLNTAQNQGGFEQPMYVGFGGDLVRYTSIDGQVWARDRMLVHRDRVAGQGVGRVSIPENSDAGLKAIYQGGVLGGASTWRLPIYGITDTKIEPTRALAALASKRALTLQPYGSVEFYAQQSPPSDVFQTANLFGKVPQNCTRVLVRCIVVGSGTAGRIYLALREGGTNRPYDADQTFEGATTYQSFVNLWVPIGPVQTIDFKINGNYASIAMLVIGYEVS